MYQTLLANASFFSLLLRIDRDLAEQARGDGCPWCEGVVHRASFWRKPRGGPVELGREHAERFSFCCSVEGCRRRVTPASVRFLGRKVFFAAVVLLVPVLRDGPTPERIRRLERALRVGPADPGTLAAVVARGRAEDTFLASGPRSVSTARRGGRLAGESRGGVFR